MNDGEPEAKALAQRLKKEREDRGWSLAELAERSNVSKAMISKIERCEASPTATLLGRLSGALGLTVSTLLAGAEDRGRRLARHDDQPIWRDPLTGYVRRALSPSIHGPIQLTLVDLPANAQVGYPASAYAFIHQQIWILEGELSLHEGETEHRLCAGDCLQLGDPVDCLFRNATTKSCRYLVAVARR